MDTKAITIVSGGLDSTTLAYAVKYDGYDQQILSFNYGQRHKKELAYAKKTADILGVPHKIISLGDFGELLKSSALTGNYSKEVPEGHYSAENMAVTVVPNRNAIMLAMAWGVAVSEGAGVLAYGAHAGDRAQYPDCRPEFAEAIEKAFQIGNEGATKIRLLTPFIHKSKAEIVAIGHQLKVPFENTWSCYKGGDLACGRCGTCVERLEAFAVNNLTDPLPYEDITYWKKAVDEFNEQILEKGC